MNDLSSPAARVLENWFVTARPPATMALSQVDEARGRIDRTFEQLHARIAEDEDRYAVAGEVEAIAQSWRELASTWRNRSPQDEAGSTRRFPAHVP